MQVQSRRSASGARHRLDLVVPATSGMLSEVRSAFAHLPLPAPSLNDAQLLVSELVANSMRHARLGPNDTVRVAAEVANGRLRVDVRDGGRGGTPPVSGAIRPRPGTESGWGLYLVETLSSRWGCGVGQYWFELEIASPTGPCE